MNQREMEREVLHVLHRAQKPQRLAELPLMQSLCTQTGESNPLAALERVVHAALPGCDRKSTALKSVILGVDFERRATNGQAARQRGVSRRHFQRLRAQAVSAIAYYATDVLGQRETRANNIPAPHRESLWRSQRERESYVNARNRANASQMRAIAANLLRIAENQESRLSAAARLADANLRLGRLDAALEQRADLSPAARLFSEAERALLYGKIADARAGAQAALRLLPPGHDDYVSVALFEAQTSDAPREWAARHDTGAFDEVSWECMAPASERARQLLRAAPLEAISLAETLWRQATRLEYNGIAARCAATLSEAARRRGDDAEERRWRVEAIERLLLTSDLIIASTLFPADGERCGDSMDDALCTVLYNRLALVIPQMQGEGRRQRGAVHGLIAATVVTLLSGNSSGESLKAAIGSVVRSDSALAHYALSAAPHVSEMLTIALVALSGRPWNVVSRATSELVAAIGARLRPARPRTFAIVLPHWPKSQSAPADHLRIDELANLRVRVVPVRSGARGTLAWQLGDTAPRAARKVTAIVDAR